MKKRAIEIARAGAAGARRRLIKRRPRRADLPPGTLVHIGDKKTETTGLTLIDYDAHELQERTLNSVAECAARRDLDTVTWFNIDGLHEVEVIEQCGKLFGIHPLVLEDIVNTDQRPKVEDYDDYVFAVVKMLRWDETAKEVRTEQVSMVLGPHYLLTFQERPGDVFEPVRERIRNSKGRIRKKGPAYLAYALVSAVVDSYFAVLEKVGDEIEGLETKVLDAPSIEEQQRIYRLKREMILLRRSVWPLREAVGTLAKGESSQVDDDSATFFRDVYDHTIHVAETVEMFRDTLSGLLDLYLSSVSNRMNEVMKVLTIIATIFIPLTFVAGIYGMNFEHMPELKLEWGYAAVWVVMLIVGASMIVFFRRKKWL